MAVSFLADDNEDEEYIDMELSSYSNFFCNSITSSSPHLREFEFQMSSASMEIEPTTSPADELFYKGRLLPLQLHHQNLLQSSGSCNGGGDSNGEFEEIYSTPLATTTVTTPTPTSTSTPFESCNISPSESCRVSGELNPKKYLFDYFSTEVSGSIGKNPKKSWTRKLKLMKQSTMIGSKLKASRAYLKSFFGKSGCSDESSASAARVGYGGGSISKAKERMDQYMKSANQNPFGQINKHQICTAAKLTDHQDNATNCHRRSFSMAIKRHSTNKSSSFSSSSSSSSSPSGSSSSNSNVSNGFQYLQLLKRSSSVNAEVESPIQGAIAHCKQSQAQQLIRSRKIVSEAGFYLLSASSFAVIEDQERPDLCRDW